MCQCDRQTLCRFPQPRSDAAICPIPPCGESDAHLGFARSIKIMLICFNLPTDAQATRDQSTEQRDTDSMGRQHDNCQCDGLSEEGNIKTILKSCLMIYRAIFSPFISHQINSSTVRLVKSLKTIPEFLKS